MDAVKEAQTAFAPVLKEWASTIPGALKDWKSFAHLAEEAETMYGAGYALGLDPGAEVVATLTGSISGGTPTLRSTTRRARGRTRGRSRGQTRSSNGAGHAPTGEQLLTFMQKHGGPITQSLAAEHFGVTRATIAKRLDMLKRKGHVTIEGTGARKMWRAKELTPA